MIPYAIDLEYFVPRNKQRARDVFGIPQESKVVLFVADGLHLYRKGYGALIEALERLSQRMPNLHLVSVGHRNPPQGLKFHCLHLGHIKDDQLLSSVYSAADVFVIPSLQDNLPNVVLESMACGTPVIGFPVGGIPEMIQHGETGLLAPPFDAISLGAAIEYLLNNSERRFSLSSNCRRMAIERYTSNMQASRYYELYRKLMEQRKAYSGSIDARSMVTR